MRELWADPGRRERFMAHYDEPGFRDSVSATVKAHWASIPEEERNEKLRKMRRRMKGGNMITDIEATVMGFLGRLMVPYIMHAEIDRLTEKEIKDGSFATRLQEALGLGVGYPESKSS